MQGPYAVNDKQITNNPHIASSIIALCCIVVDIALRCELIVRMSPMVPNPGDFLAVLKLMANMSRLSNNMHDPTMKMQHAFNQEAKITPLTSLVEDSSKSHFHESQWGHIFRNHELREYADVRQFDHWSRVIVVCVCTQTLD